MVSATRVYKYQREAHLTFPLSVFSLISREAHHTFEAKLCNASTLLRLGKTSKLALLSP